MTVHIIGSNIGIFEMNALGKIIHYIPKHSLKFGLLQTINLLKRLLMLVLGYDDIHSLRHFFHGGKSTPQYIVQILNNKDKTYLCLFLMGCMSIRTINFDLI
jgi:hypothetical protein